MRNLLVLATVLCLGVPSASAQVQVRVGVKEGGHFATFTGDHRRQVGAPDRAGSGLGRRPGLVLGGVLELVPSGPWGVQVEGLWIWKGSKETAGATTTTTTLNYAEVPVLAKYRLPLSWGALHLHLLAGVTAGLVTTGVREQHTQLPSGPPRLTGRTDLRPVARDIDLGAAVGGGVGYSFGERATLRADVRYRRSLTRTFTGPVASDGPGSAPDAWNQGIAVTLGFVYATGWTF